MYKAIFYKEWLKTRWALLLFLILGIAVLTNIFLRVRYNINFMEAHDYWYRILIQGVNYAGSLKYIPLLAGLGLAIAQYFPETVNQRIKLTFHLPIRENKVLMIQHGFGLACLIAVYALYLIFFIAGSAIFFPSDIINMTLTTIMPWFLGGLATYSMVALILLEPLWLYRVLYAVIAYGFINQFFIRTVPLAYSGVMTGFALLAIITVIVILFSGYRFRKGEMHHG